MSSLARRIQKRVFKKKGVGRVELRSRRTGRVLTETNPILNIEVARTAWPLTAKDEFRYA